MGAAAKLRAILRYEAESLFLSPREDDCNEASGRRSCSDSAR